MNFEAGDIPKGTTFFTTGGYTVVLAFVGGGSDYSDSLIGLTPLENSHLIKVKLITTR